MTRHQTPHIIYAETFGNSRTFVNFALLLIAGRIKGA